MSSAPLPPPPSTTPDPEEDLAFPEPLPPPVDPDEAALNDQGSWSQSPFASPTSPTTFTNSSTNLTKAELSPPELFPLLSRFTSVNFTHSSYLHKRGSKARTLTKLAGTLYKRRYLRLAVVRGAKQRQQLGVTATLLYFDTHESLKPKGEIPIQDILAVDTTANDGLTEFYLNITTENRVWQFSCDSDTVQKLWIGALTSLLNMLALEAVTTTVQEIDISPVQSTEDGGPNEGNDNRNSEESLTPASLPVPVPRADTLTSTVSSPSVASLLAACDGMHSLAVSIPSITATYLPLTARPPLSDGAASGLAAPQVRKESGESEKRVCCVVERSVALLDTLCVVPFVHTVLVAFVHAVFVAFVHTCIWPSSTRSAPPRRLFNRLASATTSRCRSKRCSRKRRPSRPPSTRPSRRS